jgi:putative SOS response-associated peptidase YedK
MCGRFTLRTSPETVASLFDGLEVPGFAPSWNIAPTQRVAAVRQIDARNEVAFLRWGLVPFWSNDPKIGNRMINARSETVQEKPAFRAAFRKRRCLILADGFYEWQKTAGGKQPMYIQRRDGQPFGMAGLWESNDRFGELLQTCAIITTDANEMMAPIHDRMPVILQPRDHLQWLDADEKDLTRVQSLLRPLEEGLLTAWPVSPAVNRPSFNDPSCVAPIPLHGDPLPQ